MAMSAISIALPGSSRSPSPPSAAARRPSGRHRAAVVRASADSALDGVKPRVAFLFPGQGAQSVGMAQAVAAEVPQAKDLFDRASKILGYDLLAACAGDAARLNSTAVSQPAIYVASLAAVEKLRASPGGPAILESANVAAGLSLGEYTALAFAGAFSFEDGLRLVAARGEAMQAAADAAPSGMLAIIGLESTAVEALCAAASGDVNASQAVVVANYLCPGNYAVSGGMEGIAAVEKRAKEFGAKMAVRLAVAGAFHTKFMAPAVPRLEAALASTTISSPRIPVISNVDGKAHADPGTIRAVLARQVTSPVLWESSLRGLIAGGLEMSYELGPGKVIAGIMKRVDKAAKIENVTV